MFIKVQLKIGKILSSVNIMSMNINYITNQELGGDSMDSCTSFLYRSFCFMINI
jgi:hypothetical protein